MKNFGEFFNDQIAHAGTIVLSHTDGMSEDKLAAVTALLREHNKEAIIVTTPWGDLTGQQILDAAERTASLEVELHHLAEEVEICPECGHHHHDHDHDHDHDHECECHGHHHDHDHDHECGCHGHHHDHDHECECHGHQHDHDHHHHADEVFTTFGKETTRRYTREELQTILSTLEDEKTYGQVLRAKGIVAGDGEWLHFDYVPGEPDVRGGAAGVIGRLCVIGAKLNESALEELFKLG